jgi:hypothetical protein
MKKVQNISPALGFGAAQKQKARIFLQTIFNLLIFGSCLPLS